MAYVMIEHKIGKWEEFERIFRDDVERRRMLGSKGGKVFRNIKDPENIFIAIEWENAQSAEKFADGLETHEAMEWATSGTLSRVHVVEELFEVDA